MNILNQLVTPFEIVQQGKAHELFDVRCAYCQKVHKYPKNQILAKIKHNSLRYCSQECKTNTLFKTVWVKCGFCQKDITKTPNELRKSKGNQCFCGKSCSARARNKKYPTKTELDKFKISQGLKKYNLLNPKPKKKYFCLICNKEINRTNCKRTKSCSEECQHFLRVESGKKGGTKTASSPYCKRNRSRNERLFFDKIKQLYPDTVNNVKIFNGYDADVVIPSLKLAIHWNGPWHYKPIFSKEHFNKIKQKDITRYQEVINCGYTNYIIQDFNTKLNPSKVEKEVNELIFYLNHL